MSDVRILLTFFICVVLTGAIVSCIDTGSPKNQVSIKEVSGSTPSLVVSYSDEYKGWGYDIYVDNKLFVHQPYIPAVTGLQGFKSESDAKKTGELILYKIKNQVIPPSISIHELDSLGILEKNR